MSLNKIGYANLRKSRLAVEADRDVLGERELATLETILGKNDSPIDFQDKAVVDLGCGDQYIKIACESRGMIYQGLDVEDCNFEHEPFPIEDNSVDFAISLALLEHLSDPGNFFSQVKRILKRTGVLWLSTPDIQRCGNSFWNDPTHVHPYTRSSLKLCLEMNGFRDVLVTPNYRCKPSKFYENTDSNFFRARYLMPFTGATKFPVPELFKGKCLGLFGLGRIT